MTRSPNTIAQTIPFSTAPFRDVAGGSTSQHKCLARVASLLLILTVLGCACRKQPAAVEVEGPILSMITATGFDDKGKPQNPSFGFASTAPQLVVIVHVGELDSGGPASGAHFIQLETVAAAAPESVVNIAWYRVSDESEQRLFEHQVKVQSYDRAYSIGKSKGTLLAGNYKVRATLAGQTQETELQIKPEKIRSASIASSQVTVTKASAVGDGDEAEPGEPPVDGGSGKLEVDQLTPDEPGDALDTCDTGLSAEPSRADRVTFSMMRRCHSGAPAGSHRFFANLEGERSSDVGVLDDVPGRLRVKAFAVNPCSLQGSKDLPGTRIYFFSPDLPEFGSSDYRLGPDQDAPTVAVNSSPRKGTKVKAGDAIKIDATASERRTGGTWQTGVQRFQLVREGSGRKIEELIQEVTDPSRFPKQCAQKSWSKVLGVSYTVPKHPPPIIKLCAIAEDYAGNEGFKCGEFPTGDVWEGTLRTAVTVAVLGQTCAGSWQGKIRIVVGEDGIASGEITVVDAPPNSCGGGTYAIAGSKSPIKGVVNDSGFTFAFSQFIGGQVEGSAFIQKSGRNHASGTATPSYSPSAGITNFFVMKFDLTCKTCGP